MAARVILRTDSTPHPVFSVALVAALSLAIIACGRQADFKPAPTATATSPPTQAPPPRFEGTLNGITFGRDFPPPTEMSPKCKVTTTGANFETQIVRDDPSFQAPSKLDFEFTHLPAGARFNYVGINRCEDDVILIQRDYSIPGGELQVTRKTGPAYYSAVPLSRLTETTLFGRPAVIEEGTTNSVYMIDESSSWQVTGRTSLQELIKVAAGLRSR